MSLGKVIKLNKCDANDILFCIHPVGGDIHYYKTIAKNLEPDYSVYGILMLASSNNHEPHSIETIAKEYLSLITAHIQDKPFSLLGWSMGGIIAFEMARQCDLLFQKLEKIILVDTYAPNYLPLFQKMNNKEFFYHIIQMLAAGAANLDKSLIPRRSKIMLKLTLLFHLSLSTVTLLLKIIGLSDFTKDLSELKNNVSLPTASLDPIPRWITFARTHGLISDCISDAKIMEHYNIIRFNIYAYQAYKIIKINASLLFLHALDGYKGNVNQTDWKIYCNAVEKKDIHANHYNVMTNNKTLRTICDYLSENNNE